MQLIHLNSQSTIYQFQQFNKFQYFIVYFGTTEHPVTQLSFMVEIYELFTYYAYNPKKIIERLI